MINETAPTAPTAPTTNWVKAIINKDGQGRIERDNGTFYKVDNHQDLETVLKRDNLTISIERKTIQPTHKYDETTYTHKIITIRKTTKKIGPIAKDTLSEKQKKENKENNMETITSKSLKADIIKAIFTPKQIIKALNITKAQNKRTMKISSYNFFYDFSELLLNKYGNKINYVCTPYNFSIMTSSAIALRIDNNKIKVKSINKENKQLSKNLIKKISSDYNAIKNIGNYTRAQIVAQLKSDYAGKDKSFDIIVTFKELNLNFNHSYTLNTLNYILTLIKDDRLSKSAYKKLNHIELDAKFKAFRLKDRKESAQNFLNNNA